MSKYVITRTSLDSTYLLAILLFLILSLVYPNNEKTNASHKADFPVAFFDPGMSLFFPQTRFSPSCWSNSNVSSSNDLKLCISIFLNMIRIIFPLQLHYNILQEQQKAYRCQDLGLSILAHRYSRYNF